MRLDDIVIRDPFVVPYEGRYYMYGTRSFTTWGSSAKGVDVYVSDDLEEWSEPVEVFHGDDGFWAKRCFWAPEVHIYGGAFYMFITLSSGWGGMQGTAILRSESPLGPFGYFGNDVVTTPKDWRCLDGTLYVSREGRPYMVFCREWVEVTDGQMCAMPLEPDLSAPAGEPWVLFRASLGKGWIRSLRHAASGVEGYVTDGPFFMRTGDGRLHMLWSSFGDGGYCEALAHSDSDEIDGNWSVDGELLHTDDGGHGMIFRAFDGKTYFTYHTPNTSYHEHPAIDEIRYENGHFRR